MAVTAGRQSWTNNAAYGSFMKSVMHHKDDSWDTDGPDVWYRSENGAYGSFKHPEMTSFKDIAAYRNNVKKTWEFKVAPTTYRELGGFYDRFSFPDQPPHFTDKMPPPSMLKNVNGHSTDVAVQSDSADIHYFHDGKVSRSAQITQADINDNSNYLPKPPLTLRPVKHINEPPDSPPPVIRRAREDGAMSPIHGILHKIDDRERQDTMWHRYMEEKPQMVEELKNKSVPGVREVNMSTLFVPSVHLTEHHSQPVRTGPDVEDPPIKSHFYTGNTNRQPNIERLYVSNDYGGESKWTNQVEFNSNPINTKGHRKKLPPSYKMPVYMETPWPMNRTVPIQTSYESSIGILPMGPRNELRRLGFPEKKRGIRTINDHTGTKTMYVS